MNMQIQKKKCKQSGNKLPNIFLSLCEKNKKISLVIWNYPKKELNIYLGFSLL